jgi:hypothetical protein
MRTLRTLLSSAVLIAAFVLLPGAAHAAEPAADRAPKPTGDIICFAYPVAANGARLAQPAGTPTGCHANRAAAVAAYGEAVIQASAIVGQLWDSAYYIEPWFQISTPGNSAYCADGVRWEIGWLGNFGWNDRASSVKAYGVCTALLYRDINFGGGNPYVCPSACPLLGSFTNQASSIRLHRV